MIDRAALVELFAASELLPDSAERCTTVARTLADPHIDGQRLNPTVIDAYATTIERCQRDVEDLAALLARFKAKITTH